MKHKFLWVDAFTDRKFGGNPCAVIFNADGLSSDQMQTIAKEMNLSETAFVVSSTRASFGARYFTPTEEIPLAGHPTIATICSLIEEQNIILRQPVTQLTLELKAGVVGIEIRNDVSKSEDAGQYEIAMAQRPPQFLAKHEPSAIAKIFGLRVNDFIEDVPIQTVSTGTPQLMIPVKTLEVLKSVVMDVPAYREYKSRSDFFSPHMFCVQGVTENGNTFARHFGIMPDEDAFTGSATGGMGAFLWHYDLIQTPVFIAEQGHWMGRPGQATVEVVGSPTNIETVKVAGRAVVLIRGEMNV